MYIYVYIYICIYTHIYIYILIPYILYYRYIHGAISLYLDIVNLFLHLLQIIASFSGGRDWICDWRDDTMATVNVNGFRQARLNKRLARRHNGYCECEWLSTGAIEHAIGATTQGLLWMWMAVDGYDCTCVWRDDITAAVNVNGCRRARRDTRVAVNVNGCRRARLNLRLALLPQAGAIQHTIIASFPGGRDWTFDEQALVLNHRN